MGREGVTIYLDATGFRDFQTGVGRYAYNLIKELLQIETNWKFIALVSHHVSASHPVYGLADAHRNFHIHPIRVAAIGPKRDMRFLIPVGRRDLYHCLNSNLPLAIGPRSVVTLHDIIYYHYPQFLGRLHPLKLYYYNLIMRHVARQAEHIIAVSHATANDFVRHYAKHERGKANIRQKTSVIYEGAPPPPLPLLTKTERCARSILCTSANCDRIKISTV